MPSNAFTSKNQMPSIEDLKNEFESLRNDDKDFRKMYNENEFKEWLKDNEIKQMPSPLKMEKIKTTEEAIDYIERVLNIALYDCSKFKWNLIDESNDINFKLKDDKELIEYANEQKEAEEN